MEGMIHRLYARIRCCLERCIFGVVCPKCFFVLGASPELFEDELRGILEVALDIDQSLEAFR